MCRGGDQGRGPEKCPDRSRGEGCSAATARKKLRARVGEIQQELKDVVKKCEALEREALVREIELAKARQSAEAAQNEARGALQEIQEAKKIAAGKALTCKASMRRRSTFY